MPEANSIENVERSELTSEEKQVELEKLRSLIEECTILKIRTDDIYLTRFLTVCNWNAADAFTRIKKLFKLKYENPKFFLNKELKDCKDILKQNAKLMLPRRDKKGRRIYLSRMSSVGNLSLFDLVQLDELWFETMLDEYETIENGIVLLMDMDGFSWKMLKWLAPGNVKVGSAKADLVPIKNMEVHVVNSSALMNTAVNLVFPFLSQSLKDQVYFHYQNQESLHEHLGKECVPSIYGGTLEDINFDDLNNFLYSNEDTLSSLRSYGFIESPNLLENNSNDKKKSKKSSIF